jgi:ABC-type transport system involved in cytochrome c biogenesis ATPase subunit
MCCPHPPEFDESETVGIIARDTTARNELIETFLGRRTVDVNRDGARLDARAAGDLKYLTGVCGSPPAWLTRETVDENFRWIFRCRSLRYDRARVKDALASVSLADWHEPPRLAERVETLPALVIRVLALARLLFVPHRVFVLVSPLAGVADGELSLLLDTLQVVREAPGLKLIVAERRSELPPFCDRVFSAVRSASGLAFAEEAQ